MFTGLVEALGTVRRIDTDGPGKRLTIDVPFAGELTAGESVALNGACLTVTEYDERESCFQAGPETLARTTRKPATSA